MFEYPAVLTPQDGGFAVTFPGVPEAITQGDSKEDALIHARDALETALSMYVDEWQRLPKPTALKRGQHLVIPCVQACAKLLIYSAMIEGRVTKSHLARLLDCHLPQVDRLLDLNHASRLDQLERALAVLGRRLTVDVLKVA